MLPSDSELPALIATLQDQLQHAETLLAPYRANNTAPPTEEEVALIEANWTRWREEWKKRKVMFKGLVVLLVGFVSLLSNGPLAHCRLQEPPFDLCWTAPLLVLNRPGLVDPLSLSLLSLTVLITSNKHSVPLTSVAAQKKNSP